MLKTVLHLRVVMLLSIIAAGHLPAYGHDEIYFTISGSGSYCAGGPATLYYTAHSVSFTTGNILTAELSDASGNFSSPALIGTLASTTATGLINITFPANASGTGYRIRIVSSHPAVTGSDNGSNLTINQPTVTSVSVAITGGTNILCDTHDATFNATPTGGGTSPAYQWYINGNTAGINSATFNGTGLQDGDKVFCKMTSNSSCPSPEIVPSNTITIIRKTTATPGVTVAGPPAICSGLGAEFTATPANGGTTPSYQWKKNGDNVGTNAVSYADPVLLSGDVISCVMTSNRECLTTPTATSSNFTVDVTPIVTPTIQITEDPATTVGAGSVIYLSMVITGGGTSPIYQWKRNGDVIGTTNALSLTTLNNGDIIKATLTSNEFCAQPNIVQSNEIVVSVDANLTRSKHAWEQRASQPDGANALVRSNASGFSVGSKGFVGLGYVMTETGITYRKDLWQYDPATDVWTQKADFPGAGRYNAVGFNIGNMGYVGTGLSATGTHKDFWQYDPTGNSWIQRADFPGAAREQAFGFGIGNTKGYVGGGFTNGQGDYKDFYEFDPLSNSWRSRAEFAGGKRMGSATFTIDQKGFVAGGYSSSTDTWYKDFWDFDQAANLWTKRADMPGNGRTRATGFSIAGNGYVGLGYSKGGYEGQFFQYTTSSNSWSWKPYYPGPVTSNMGTGMSIGNRGFIYKDGKWIEYNILTIEAVSSKLCSTENMTVSWDASGFIFGPNNVFTAHLSPQPNFSISSILGTTTSQGSAGAFQATVPASTSAGVYYLRITSSNPVMSTLLEQVTITALPANHNITAEKGATVCKDTPASFHSNFTGTGFQWFRNNKPVGTDSPDYVDGNLATGDVIKSVKSYTAGCNGPVGVSSNSINMTVKTPQKPVVTVTPNILSSTPAMAYQWYFNDGSINGAAAQTYQMTKNGVYKVRTTDNSGCFAFSDEIKNLYVGLEDEYASAQISIFPNPAMNELTLQITDDLVSQGCSYSVLNELGQPVVATQTAGTTNRISLTGRAPGLYLVRLTLNGETIVRRFLKVE
ncbi:MAG TPA: T9SS type A sorting domain-containing protein [Cyclobacteriaceae bacterium]|nr:T9SS type A sorting domain-containing protein [Cyclobacteriaceae bacterium]